MLPTVSNPDSLAFRLFKDCDWVQGRGMRGASCEFCSALSMIFDSPEPLWIAWGPGEKRFFFNDAYLPLLRGKLQGAMGNRLDVVWSDVWDDVKGLVEETFGGKAQSLSNMTLRMDRDGFLEDTVWTFSYSPLRIRSGEVKGMLCVVSEQTELVAERNSHSRHIESITEEARAAHLELVSAREQLRQSQKLEAMGQLTGGVAHDFNNLLQVISGSADMLRHVGSLTPQQSRYVNGIAAASDRATKLTAQLLAFARRQSLTPEVFDLVESIRSIADIVSTLVGPRVQVEIEMPHPSIPVIIDRNQLDTAVINIAVNARDAIDGNGKLTIRAEVCDAIPVIRSGAVVAGNYVALSFKDTGSGIAAGAIERIFEPFYTTKEVGAGTGLGLSQVFGFVKQSEGDIDVKSVPGEGTTFTLYLPRSEFHGEPERNRDTFQDLSGKGISVLLVEDNPDVADFAYSALKGLDYGVVHAYNVDEALQELERDHQRFSAVFSDVVMPGRSGVELAHVIKERYPQLPVILTSGYSELLAQDPNHGFVLLKKPYSLAQLAQALSQACRKDESGSALQATATTP